MLHGSRTANESAKWFYSRTQLKHVDTKNKKIIERHLLYENKNFVYEIERPI